MKRALIVASALALFASPVVAQKSSPETAKQPTIEKAQPKGPNDVWCGGVYLGSDPDPNVRLQLLKSHKQPCD